MIKALFLILVINISFIYCWPGMMKQQQTGSLAGLSNGLPKVGPTCTVKAHGYWPDAGYNIKNRN